MNMIVTADENWAIGYRGKQLVSIPINMKFFREITEGKVVVMGRKTMEELPGGRPVPGRTNFVLSGREDFHVKGACVVHSIEELLARLQQYPSKDVFVIGGESVFKQLLPHCELVHVTKIYHRYQADSWFPALDGNSEWRITGDSEEMTYFDMEYQFFRYERV